MKQIILNLTKAIFIIGILFCANSTTAQIHSTTDGGVWHHSLTWVGGTVPYPWDDVVINGSVSFGHGECNNLTISPTGSLSGLSDDPNYPTKILTVNGNITNNGGILPMGTPFEFVIKAHGNIYNHHYFRPNIVDFVGTTNQYVSSSKIKPFVGFTPGTMNSNKPSGYVHFNSTHYLSHLVTIDFGSDTLYMDTDTLWMEGGKIKDVTIISNSTSGQIYISLVDDFWGLTSPYVKNVNIEANEVVLDGIFLYDEFFNIFGNARVEGVLKNNSNTSHIATINGNLTNNGIIQDNNTNCYLYITGDIYQNGSWTNNHTYLSGDADQNLLFTKPFDGKNLTNSNNDGKVISNSTLTFNSTIIDFNYDTLMFAAGADSLIVNGDYFQEAVIAKEGSKTSGFLNCTLNEGAYFRDMVIIGNTISIGASGNAYFRDMDIIGDNIYLSGAFEFRAPMSFYGHVTVEDTLRNHSGISYLATINGNVTNNGVIEDNTWFCYLYITGDIYQNGSWTNNHTYLSGDTDQTLTFIQPFEGNSLTNSNNNGKVISNSTLTFNNTVIDFNYDTLMFAAGADSLIVNGAYFQEAVITKEGNKTSGFLNCTLGENAYFHDMDIVADNISIGGAFQYDDPMSFYGHVTVDDTLRNRSNTNQTATINGNLTNNGIIEDNIWNCNLYITGDINQNGNWTNKYTYLSGDAGQNLAFTMPFAGEYFTSLKLTGTASASTPLWFNNTIIDFNNDSLYMNAGYDSIYLDGGYLTEMNILAGNLPMQIYCHHTGNAWFDDVNIEANEVVLGGAFQFMTYFNIYGDVIVEDTLRNRNNSTYTANIIGGLTNNGVIENNSWLCYLNITGDINQNGIWDNQRTTLNGDSDQFIYLLNQNEITGQVYFDALSAGTPYQWYYDGGILNAPDFTGETSNALIWQVPVNGNWYGNFYCETGAGPSRTITIEGGLIVDIALMLEGPFNGTDMNTTLNSNGHIPLAQPYNISPWNYAGTESVASIPADIVDWVLVEFRETSGGPETATAATTIKQRALFLNNEGYLVNLDGTRDIKINVPSVTENLHVVVWHRNHLGVMSANPLSFTEAPFVYDFTSGAGQVYGGLAAHKNLGGGIYGMMGGDADYDQDVDVQDKSAYWSPNAGTTASYVPYDFNMDNEIDNRDKNDVWSGNSGSSTQVPD